MACKGGGFKRLLVWTRRQVGHEKIQRWKTCEEGWRQTPELKDKRLYRPQGALLGTNPAGGPRFSCFTFSVKNKYRFWIKYEGMGIMSVISSAVHINRIFAQARPNFCTPLYIWIYIYIYIYLYTLHQINDNILNHRVSVKAEQCWFPPVQFPGKVLVWIPSKNRNLELLETPKNMKGHSRTWLPAMPVRVTGLAATATETDWVEQTSMEHVLKLTSAKQARLPLESRARLKCSDRSDQSETRSTGAVGAFRANVHRAEHTGKNVVSVNTAEGDLNRDTPEIRFSSLISVFLCNMKQLPESGPEA